MHAILGLEKLTLTRLLCYFVGHMFESIHKFSHYHGVHHYDFLLKSSMDTVKCEIHVRIGDRYVAHTLIQITPL